MKILYFAWLRQRVGTGEETVDPPAEITTAGGLIEWLRTRGEGYAQAFQDDRAVKIAVNQTYGNRDTPVKPGDEVAFFPPVTGG